MTMRVFTQCGLRIELPEAALYSNYTLLKGTNTVLFCSYQLMGRYVAVQLDYLQ